MKENKISYRLYGSYALFTDPLSRIGGEKTSLMIPTYQALVGITESVYWKPSIRWVVDRVRIMKAIQTESKGMRPIGYGGGNDLAFYTYLSDVEYQVEAHFEFNHNRKDLEQDFNENKHYFIARRCLDKGGRRDIFLGVRECQGYVEPVQFGEGEGHYDGCKPLNFGLQFHSFSYPDDNGENILKTRFWRPEMENGIIEFCRPEDCILVKELHKSKMKTFTAGTNFSGVEEEGLLEGYEEGAR